MQAMELIVYKKTEVLLNNTYPILKNFPKSEKIALCQEIKQAFYALLKDIVLANNLKYKKRQFQDEADAYLKLLYVLFSVAKQQKYITEKKNMLIQLRLDEIGRLLGGWMKSSK